MVDVFVSYSRRDGAAAARLVEAIRRAGLSVFWDEDVAFGAPIGKSLEEALAASRRVLLLLTPNVGQTRNDYVLSEMDRARDAEKLLVVKVGEFTIPLLYEGLVIGHRMMLVPSFDALQQGPSLEQLCRVLGAPGTGAPQPPPGPAAVEEWFGKGPTADEIAFALAVAVAEGAPFDVVGEIARDLARRLEPPTDGAGRPLADRLTTRSQRLRRVGATVYKTKSPRYGVEIDCIRFEDPGRAVAVLEYVWDELLAVREDVVAWLTHLTKTLNRDERSRIGLHMGTLARARFAAMFDNLLRDWLFDDHAATRDVADIALAIAAVEPAPRRAISTLARDIAKGRDPSRLRGVVELACGHTGSRIEGLSIAILKQVARAADDSRVVREAMCEAIAYMVQASTESSDNSLYDLEKLIGEFADWARSPNEDEPERLPMFLFLQLMERLPFTAPRRVEGLMSLDALVRSERACKATAEVLAAALRDPGDEKFDPRESAEAVLRRWNEASRAADPEPERDPLLKLYKAIYVLCTTDRDRRRLLFLAKRRYGPDRVMDPSEEINLDLEQESERGDVP